jgi:hypothetical protein
VAVVFSSGIPHPHLLGDCTEHFFWYRNNTLTVRSFPTFGRCSLSKPVLSSAKALFPFVPLDIHNQARIEKLGQQIQPKTHVFIRFKFEIQFLAVTKESFQCLVAAH